MKKIKTKLSQQSSTRFCFRCHTLQPKPAQHSNISTPLNNVYIFSCADDLSIISIHKDANTCSTQVQTYIPQLKKWSVQNRINQPNPPEHFLQVTTKNIKIEWYHTYLHTRDKNWQPSDNSTPCSKSNNYGWIQSIWYPFCMVWSCWMHFI